MGYTTTTPPPKTPLALKLLAHALNPAARDGEAENAGVKCVRACRRERIGLPELVTALVPVRQRAAPALKPEPAACEIRMPWGKHEGEMLREIAEREISNLVWLIENVTTQPWIADAEAEVVRYFTGARS